MMTTIKAWAASAFSGVGSFIVQWLATPGNVEGVTSAVTDWVSMLIVSGVTAIVAWIGTYFAPKNAEQ